MNFEQLKNILKQIEEKGYIILTIFEDHGIVKVNNQENEETEKLIIEKLNDIFNKVNMIGGYKKYNKRITVFVNTEKINKILEEGENYEKIESNINEKYISYIHKPWIREKGTDKHIELWITNYNPENIFIYNPNDIETIIENIISENLPTNAFVYRNGYKTSKATSYEKKKQCCEEIKIMEDFDEILSKL